jgi:hypothetical protein
MKKVLLALILHFIVSVSFAQEERKNIYSGGMLILQPGFTMADNNHQNIEDMSNGIGGILRFYLFKYFTTGIYGGSQRTVYKSMNSENSNISLGYGGPFIGFSHKSERFRYTASAFAGMGTVRNLHIENQSGNELSEAYLYKHSAFVLSTILSVDYALTQRLMLTFQTVYLVARYDKDQIMQNPTLQVGLLFNR